MGRVSIPLAGINGRYYISPLLSELDFAVGDTRRRVSISPEIVDAVLSTSHLPAVACAPRWQARAPPVSSGDYVPGGARPAFTGGSNDWRDIHVPVRPVFPEQVSLRRSVRAAPGGARIRSVRDHAESGASDPFSSDQARRARGPRKD